MLNWWTKKWLQYLLVICAVELGAFGLLHLISLNGAPGWQEFTVFVAITQVCYWLAASLDVFLTRQGKPVARACWFSYLLRLFCGIALFPVICVLFLNRSKL